MNPDFWHGRWQANRIGFHQGETNSHLRRYWPQMGLAKDSRVLVPLCGKSLDMLWLLELGHPVVGIEISQLAIEAFFDENGLTPGVYEAHYGRRFVADRLEVLCADFFALTQEDIGKVNAFFDRAALIALTPTQRERYAEHLNRLLARDSAGLLITLEYNQSEMSGPPFSVPREEICRLFDSAFTIEELFQFDALADNQKFREQGLSKLSEHVWQLRRRLSPARPSKSTTV